MADFSLLQRICETPGAPGFEHPIRTLLEECLTGCADSISTDAMGNLTVFRKGLSSKKLLLTAHMDEIAFIVQHIDDDGFVRFLPLGGFDPKTLTAQRVVIHGRENVYGVMGSKPIHLMGQDERNKAPNAKDYFIDTGMAKGELNGRIGVGDPITRERSLIRMGRCFNSKSLDNRVSVYALVELFRRLEGRSPGVDLYGVFTVQEELGLRGAQVAATRVAPDLAINIDTTIAYDVPGSQAHEVVTRLGKGVAIKLFDSSVVPDVRMVRFLKQLADGNGIPWQAELMSGGGTDTGAVQRAGTGTLAGAISIPTRHLHQVIEMVHEDDVDAAVTLLECAVRQIADHPFSYA